MSVIVCTRDRPSDLARCLASLERACPQGCQVVVVDQSEGPETGVVVRAAASGGFEPEHLRSSSVGLSLARNEGAAHARGELLLFTDDDCEVGEGWVVSWASVLGTHPEAGIGFGRILASPFDPRSGYVHSFDPGPGDRSSGLEYFMGGASSVGGGGNMAVRRLAWAAVGGFDELLGAGAPFPGAEEIDLALRLAKAGYRIAHSQQPALVHHGQLARKQASRRVKGYAVGTGAMYLKHVRSGYLRAAELLALEVGRLALGVARGALMGTRPLGANSLLYLIRGALESIAWPVDRRQCLYQARATTRRRWKGQRLVASP